MAELDKIIAVLLVASTKHLLAPATAYVAGFKMLEVILYTTLGGVGGVFFFMYFAGSVKKAYLWFLKKRGKTPRKFTRTNRFIVRVKQRFGLYGLAFITPLIISVPVGSIIAATIYKNKIRAFAYLAAGVLFWSIVGSSIFGPISKLL